MKILILQVLTITGIYGGITSIQPKIKNYNFEVLPSHKNHSLMARFIVHYVDWTAVSYTSYEKQTFNLSLAAIFSSADGPMSNGTGVPYFFLTELEPAVRNLVRNDSRCGLMMSLVQTGICEKKKWDPEDPRCARVYLAGYLKPLSNKTAEYEFAKKSFTARHPHLANLPPFHKFFYAKYVIQSINIITGYGGIVTVSLKDYYGCNDSKYNLTQGYYDDTITKI